jgi:hypothetical protein
MTEKPQLDAVEEQQYCQDCQKFNTKKCKFADDKSPPNKDSLACDVFKPKKEPKILMIQKPTVLTEDFLAEEIWDHKHFPNFYVYYFDGREPEVKHELDLGETDKKGRLMIYVPVDNNALRKGLVTVPTIPQECTFSEAFEFTDEFALKCYDPCGQLALMRLLLRIANGSWFLDRFIERSEWDIAGCGKYAPIIPIRGPSQAGKNRLAFVLRMASYRPYFEMSTYRIPSLYRPLDVWKGSLILDEADFAQTTEKSEVIHFLNCRATGTPISRQDPKNPAKTDVFTNFGITTVTQRREFEDNATESRCIPFYSEATDKQLPTVETDEMIREGLLIQNMMLWLRTQYFESFHIDKTEWVNDISDPRLVASLLPLLALAKYEPNIKSTISETVKAVQRMKIEAKAGSEDGMVINALWDKGLFARHESALKPVYYFQVEIQGEDEDLYCVPLTTKAFAEEMKSTPAKLRRVLNSLHLVEIDVSDVVKIGKKSYRPIFFSPNRLEKRLREFVVDYEQNLIYEKLGLDVPGSVTKVTQVTDLVHGNQKLESFMGEKNTSALSMESVTSVTNVTESQNLPQIAMPQGRKCGDCEAWHKANCSFPDGEPNCVTPSNPYAQECRNFISKEGKT